MTISGTYHGASDSGVVSGVDTAHSVVLQLTHLYGTQRTLSNSQLPNGGLEIKAGWNDDAGLSGAVCIFKPGPGVCA